MNYGSHADIGEANVHRHVEVPGTTSAKNGGLAQLARAPALQAGGQRFESVILHTDATFCCKRSLTYWTTQDSLREQSQKEYEQIKQ